MPRQKTFALLLSLLLATLTLYADPAEQLTSVAPKKDGPPPRCPALQLKMTGGGGNNFGNEIERYIELVLLATAEKTAENTFQLTVKKPILGGNPGKTVTLQNSGDLPKTPQIYILRPNFRTDEPEYHAQNVIAADEEKGQHAMAYARLALDVLSSYSIVLAKEISATDPSAINIEVERTILGHTFRAGEKISIYHRDFPGLQAESPEPEPVRLKTGSMIYIVQDQEPDSKHYMLDRRLYPSAESEIAAIYKNRNNFPIREIELSNKTVDRYREITFQGSLEDAIELLSSVDDKVVDLARDALADDTEKSIPLVLAATKKHISNRTLGETKSHLRLRNMIGFLANHEQGEADGPLDKLLQDQIALAGVELWPIATTPEPMNSGEENVVSANHSLTWLLMSLGNQTIIKRGPQLLAAREKAHPGARHELDIAIGAADIPFRLELAEARKIKQPAPTLITAPTPLVRGARISFSPNGKLFAVDGTIFNFPEFTRVGKGIEGRIDTQMFSPTNNSLIITAEDSLIEYNFEGKELRKIEIEDLDATSLTADASRVLSHAHSSKQLAVIDTASGRTIRNVKVPERIRYALSPDGKRVAWTSDENKITLARVDDPQDAGKEIAVENADSLIFSPDCKFLIVRGEASHAKSETPITVFDTAELRKIASVTLSTLESNNIAVPPDGKSVVFGEREGRIWRAEFPELKNIAVIPPKNENSYYHPGSQIFSPDGKYFVVGYSNETPRFYRTDNFEPVIFGEAHGTHVQAWRFASDGKTFRTFAADSVCTFESGSLKLLRRAKRIDVGDYISISPDGLHYLCLDGKEPPLRNFHSSDKNANAKVVETDTGKILSEFPVADPHSFKITWLKEQKLLLVSSKLAARIDCLTGKTLETRAIGDTLPLPPDFEPAAISLYALEENHMYFHTKLKLKTLDPKTGQVAREQECPLPHSAYQGGLIADEKYVALTNPGVMLFDRATLKLLLDVPMNCRSTRQIALSRDGTKFAVLSEARTSFRNGQREPDDDLITVYDALTGKITAVFPRESHCTIDFSPDARRLLVTEYNGALYQYDIK